MNSLGCGCSVFFTSQVISIVCQGFGALQKKSEDLIYLHSCFQKLLIEKGLDESCFQPLDYYSTYLDNELTKTTIE